MNALDLPLTVTLFSSVTASSLTRQAATLRELQAMALDTAAAEKSALPLIKLAEFGDYRTPGGSLRNNRNVQSICGAEGDYDGQVMTLNQAAEGATGRGPGGAGVHLAVAHGRFAPVARAVPHVLRAPRQ